MGGSPSQPSSSLWGQLPAPNRRWIVVNALVGAAVVNLILNAVLTALGTDGQGEVQIWGAPLAKETSLFGGALGCLFLLPLITCLLVTGAVRRDVRLGSLEPLEQLRAAHRWLAALPAKRLRRGAALGGLALVAVAPLLALALLVVDPGALSEGQFVVWQTAFAVALGALVTPVIAVVAMADPPA